MAGAFQVVFEWGAEGLRAHPAHVTVIADADAGASGDALIAAALAEVEAGVRAIVLRADLSGAAAAAQAAYDAQVALGDRASIAVIAPGDSWPGGALRPCAADEIVAGAVIDELCRLGIDFHSPACAVACAAYVSLRGAARSLIRAEAASRETMPVEGDRA